MKPLAKFLMVYPLFDPSYWGMQYSLQMVKRKALMPPLGLLTIAAMTPSEYEIRVVDLNCNPLTDDAIAWADVVLFSAMLVQKKSLFETAKRCREAGKTVVFGGPFPTACPDECRPHADIMVLNEGEITWPQFLKDFAAGRTQPVYTTTEKPDIVHTPCPRFDLVNVSDYVTIPIQYSRGCPFQCEFCDIIVLFGRKPRTKTPAQILKELDALLAAGYLGRVFIVDDNFIGNKKEVQTLLPELKRWNDEHGWPFSYGTEASVNLAEDPVLLKAMVDAGFIFVFIGVESPSAESLRETRKLQNVGGSLADRIRAVQDAGLIVYGGFIIGFDSDTDDIFERQIAFITQTAIANAMVGPILALPGTPLFDRMKREGRLVEEAQDYSTWHASGYTNIRTIMPRDVLLQGHRRIVETLYDPRAYFGRVIESFRRLPRPGSIKARWRHFRWLVNAELKRSAVNDDQSRVKPSAWKVFRFVCLLPTMFPDDFRREVWRFLWRVLWLCPEELPRTLSFIVMGYHCNRFTHEYVIPTIDKALAEISRDDFRHQEAS